MSNGSASACSDEARIEEERGGGDERRCLGNPEACKPAAGSCDRDAGDDERVTRPDGGGS